MIGTIVSHYRIVEKLGGGGMGVVYKAEDLRLKRAVALKFLLRESSAEQGALERFRLEAHAASVLNHPNICTIYDLGDEGGMPFIVMEYVTGRTLSEILESGGLLAGDVARFGAQIADALAHAHARGIIHRDLKAANVMAGPDGRVKVLDFGLAKLLHSEDVEEITQSRLSLTAIGTVVGTLPYMAPEVLRGEPADARSDIWALGVLLYAMAAGRHPFRGSTGFELSAAIMHDPVAPLPEHVPVGLQSLIQRCLAKEPSRRYPSAGEVRDSLQGAGGAAGTLDGAPGIIEEQPVPLPPALAHWKTSTTECIGREEELAILSNSWTQSRAGRRQLVLVAGEPGIGKTRLVAEFALALGEERATVLLGRCDREALAPYQPFVEALDWYVRTCSEQSLRAIFAGRGASAELVQLLPELARRVELERDPVRSNPEGHRYRLFEAVASLLAEATRIQPLLLILEDLHWADKPTLLLLRHIVRSSHEGAFCIVITYRETELGRMHPLAELLSDLRGEPVGVRVALRGIHAEDVRRLITSWTGSEASAGFARLLTDNTDGNPFFISETLRHLTETGAFSRLQEKEWLSNPQIVGLPEGVKEVIGRRLGRLSEGCNRVLKLASVVGREFSLDVLQALADLPEDAVLDAIDEALAARVIEEEPASPGHCSFTHALFRETLYGEFSAVRRMRLHLRVGEALARLAPAGREPLADLAYHFAQAVPACDAGKAADFAVRAAERAAAAFAIEDAARFYEMALDSLESLPSDPSVEAQRLDLHSRRGHALFQAGQWAAAKNEIEAALSLLGQDQKERRCELLLELAWTHFWLLNLPEVRRVAEEALTLATHIGREDMAASGRAWFGLVLLSEGGSVQPAIELIKREYSRIESTRSVAWSASLVPGIPLNLYWVGRLQEAIELGGRTVQSARDREDPFLIMYALSHQATALTGAGRYDEASRTFHEARDFGKRFGVLPLLARAMSMEVALYLNLHDYRGAEACAREARALARQVGFLPPAISAGVDLLLIAARTHDPGRGEALLPEVELAAAQAGGWHGWLWRLRLAQARAELAFARGDFAKAVDAAGDCVEQSRTQCRVKYEALGLATRARALLALGDRTAAIDDARNSAEVARRLDDPAVLLTALSVLLALTGDDSVAAEAEWTTERILKTVSDETLSRRFLESEMVQSARRDAR